MSAALRSTSPFAERLKIGGSQVFCCTTQAPLQWRGFFMRRGSPMSDRKPTCLALPAAIVLAAAFYLGAYYWMVRQGKYSGTPYYLNAPYVGPFDAEWERANQRYVRFFAPAHWLDRRLRSAKWNVAPSNAY